MIPVPKPVRYVEEEKRAWIRTLPCLLAGEEPCTCGPYIDVVRKTIASEAAHVRSRGAGGDDHLLVPLCSHHHRSRGDSLHIAGIKTFERRHDVNLKREALGLDRAWQQRAA